MPDDLKALQNSLNLKSIEAEAARAPTLARIAQERTDDLATANGTIDDMKDANAAVKTAADAAKPVPKALPAALKPKQAIAPATIMYASIFLLL